MNAACRARQQVATLPAAIRSTNVTGSKEQPPVRNERLQWFVIETEYAEPSRGSTWALGGNRLREPPIARCVRRLNVVGGWSFAMTLDNGLQSGSWDRYGGVPRFLRVRGQVEVFRHHADDSDRRAGRAMVRADG